jgi:methylmalonyl-CoA/ethylmalonyl-CoA epimerase
MKKQFEKIFQVGIIVDNVENFVKRYENGFGIGPWDIVDFTPDLMPGMTVDGEVKDLRMKIAFCRSFGTELELIQPVSESIYMDWLRQHGPGLHHVAFVLNDYDSIMSDLVNMGKKPLMEVLDGSKSRGFAYVDLLKELGIILEMHKGKPG